MNFTWINIYSELATKLLAYKNNRAALVEWIYSDLGKVTRADGQSLVNYLKMKDGAKIKDIDPFSVYGIFNRNTSWEKRTELLQKFKEHFELVSEVPTDFNGIPTLDARRSFFFSWNDDNQKVIHDQWDLYEKIVTGEEAESAFDKVLENGMARYSLTMCLFWIAPDRFLSLDSRNRSYLESFGFHKDYPILRYAEYQDILQRVQKAMDEGTIPCSSFLEFSYLAWKSGTESPKDERTVVPAKKNYWLVGYAFGSSNSQFERFINDSIWEGRFNDDSDSDQKLLSLAKQIKKGDVLILKSSSTKGPKHDKSFLRVKAVAVVMEDIQTPKMEGTTSCRCKVKYYGTEVRDFDNPTLGSFRKTIHLADSKAQPLIEYANNLIGIDTMPQQKYKEYIDLLLENRNIVLTGAPGTGKTFMAQEIAKEMGAETKFVQFHPSYDYTDFVEGLRPVGDSGNFGFELRNGVFKDFCARALQNQIDSKKSIQALQQESTARDRIDGYLDDVIETGKTFNTVGTKNVFHVVENNEKTIIVEVPANEKTSMVKLPKSDLIALVENNVTVKSGKDIQIYFARKHGTQQDAYVRVLYNHIKDYKPKEKTADVSLIELKPFVFIIDEINRGEISKIFGELFFSIDPGYRGERGRVNTQYQNMIPDDDVFKKGFFVPENVYIIGTMNDIDRSVESMDFAMRRRFTWKEVTPKDTESMLDTLTCVHEAKATMARLNKAITETDGLGAAYQIGPSYFLKLEKNGGNFSRLWEMNIEPLLKEYLRGFRKTSETLDKFKAAYFGAKEETTTDSIELIDED